MRFLEHISGKAKVWDFDLAAYAPGDAFPALLAPPPACEVPCAVLAEDDDGYPGCTWNGTR